MRLQWFYCTSERREVCCGEPVRNIRTRTQCFFDFPPIFVSTDAPEAFPAMDPALVPSPTTQTTLIAAMAEVEAFARRNIKRRAFWRFFSATAGKQRSHGMWQLVRPGLQVVLLELMELPKPSKTSWISRPTGIKVIDGAYDSLTEGSTDGCDGFLQLYTGDRHLITEPLRYSAAPVLGSCSILVARLFPFPGTPADRALSHTIGSLDRDHEDTLYTEMLRLLAG